MRIGINTRYLQYQSTGITKYLLNLILNLKKIDGSNNYLLFFDSDKPLPKAILEAGFDYVLLRVPTHHRMLKGLWAYFYLPYLIKKNKLDLYHEPFLIGPAFKKCPTVITVFDMAYLHVPYGYTYAARLYFKSLFSRSIKQSDLAVAISENTKNDVINNFSISPDKVQVVYAGVDEIFRPINDKKGLEKVRKVYGIKKDFILAVSLISPRKNLVRLIKAFKLLRDKKNIDCQLVIVGRKGWLYGDIFREVRLSGLEEEVVFCGYVPRKDLLYLYNAAAIFVYPSLYEGFGLPILEAMACGCPVVASNTSSMPEVCGEAALLVNPHNTEELTGALAKAREDRSLCQSLVEKGLSQAKKFSWEKAAKETLAVYTKARSFY